MEHILNRRTTTILTYINQGRRPAAFPVSLPVRPAAGPVRACVGGKNEDPPGSPWGLDRGEPYRVKAAARYSPTPSRVQYHRRAGP